MPYYYRKKSVRNPLRTSRLPRDFKSLPPKSYVPHHFYSPVKSSGRDSSYPSAGAGGGLYNSVSKYKSGGTKAGKHSNKHSSRPEIKRFDTAIRRHHTDIDVRNKTFDEIKGECLRKNILFEDPEFPANDESLFFNERPRMNFKWKRPHEIASDPQLFVGGASRFDILQGELGDCWLLAAIASLSLNQDLLYRIIPPDQTFKRNDYAGIFHFQFWQYGEWVDVIIDDLLPTFNGKLVYLHSAEKNEFWSPLLEKAYAKLHGSFEALKGGSTTEAMEDFTGGVSEIYELNNPPKDLYRLMEKSLKKGALMGCAIDTQNAAQREAKLPNGLLMGHAYSITGVEQVRKGDKLVRVRNPWGQVEWNGPWSDSSSKWNEIPGDKKRLDVEFSEDGEFWMSFRDFCKNFTKLEICNLGPDALEDDEFSSQWITSLHDGRWIRGCTAGGCRNFPGGSTWVFVTFKPSQQMEDASENNQFSTCYCQQVLAHFLSFQPLDTFWINPQFRLTLEEEDDDPYDKVQGCSFIVSLMQKNRRKQKSKGHGLLTIGFAIYKLKKSIPSNQVLKKDFFLYNQSAARSKQFINLRENCERFKLPPGEYIIVPSTFQPNEEADFVLRLYTEKRSHVNELDEETKQTAPLVKEVDDEESQENDRRFRVLFDQLTGEDGEIDAFELQDIVNSVMKKNLSANHTFTGFGLEACRSMVALTDVTESGKLDYQEFKVLWVRVRKWINVFKTFDTDNSGTFDSFELREALLNAGFSLSSKLYQKLCIRYANSSLKINMNDFVLLSVRLEEMFNSFNRFKVQGKNTANISLNDWLNTTMYS